MTRYEATSSEWPVMLIMLQVLFVDVRMRLLTDIAILWQSVIDNLEREDLAVGLVARLECTPVNDANLSLCSFAIFNK